MWIVRIALRRPYTFVVLALLILMVGPLTIARTPTDIFPEHQHPGRHASSGTTAGCRRDEMSTRIVSIYERNLTTTVNDIEHIESQSLRGIAVVKVFFQPGANIDLAVAQVTALGAVAAAAAAAGHHAAVHPQLQRLDACRCCSSRCRARRCPSSSCSTSRSTSCARSWPASAARRSRIRTAASSRRSRSISTPRRCRPSDLTPADVVNAISVQNLILPGGTQKLGAHRIRRRPQRQPEDDRGAERPADPHRRRQRRSTSTTSPTSATASRRRPTSSASTARARRC